MATDAAHVLTLVGTPRPQRPAQRADGRFVILLVRFGRGVHTAIRVVTQREMDRFGRDVLGVCQHREIAQQRLGRRRARTERHESIAATAQLDAEPLFDEAQVGIERTTEIGQRRVVGCDEFEFAALRRLGRSFRHGPPRLQGSGRAANANGPR